MRKKAFDAPVALGLADECRRRLDAEEPNLVLEVVAHVNAGRDRGACGDGRASAGKPKSPGTQFALGDDSGKRKSFEIIGEIFRRSANPSRA